MGSRDMMRPLSMELLLLRVLKLSSCTITSTMAQTVWRDLHQAIAAAPQAKLQSTDALTLAQQLKACLLDRKTPNATSVTSIKRVHGSSSLLSHLKGASQKCSLFELTSELQHCVLMYCDVNTLGSLEMVCKKFRPSCSVIQRVVLRQLRQGFGTAMPLGVKSWPRLLSFRQRCEITSELDAQSMVRAAPEFVRTMIDLSDSMEESPLKRVRDIAFDDFTFITAHQLVSAMRCKSLTPSDISEGAIALHYLDSPEIVADAGAPKILVEVS